jgi:hypothetical protein
VYLFSPTFPREKSLFFRRRKVAVKVPILQQNFHFSENFRGSGITSFEALFPHQKVFDPRSEASLKFLQAEPPLRSGSYRVNMYP